MKETILKQKNKIPIENNDKESKIMKKKQNIQSHPFPSATFLPFLNICTPI